MIIDESRKEVTATLCAAAMTALEQLEATKDEAEQALRHAQEARERKRASLSLLAEQELDAEFKALTAKLFECAREAKAEWVTERDRLAIENATPPFPVGTKIELWRQLRPYGRDTDTRTVERTGIIGIVEIITASSEHGAMVVYSRALVGESVARLLKKDGTPGKKYQRFMESKWIPLMWRPVDVDLNEELHGEKLAAARKKSEAFTGAAREVFGL